MHIIRAYKQLHFHNTHKIHIITQELYAYAI